MSQKLSFLIVGRNLSNLALKCRISSLNPCIWDLKCLDEDISSIKSNLFIGGLLFEYACPTTDSQLLTNQFLKFSVFIGQQ